MSHNKISVVVLGSGDSLKRALITNILGKDLSRLSKRNVLNETEIYENDTYEFTCTPDLYTECEDIKDLFVLNQHPDMSLLVVEDGFSTEVVCQQIEKLKETTGKPTEEFIVVLPLNYKHTDFYSFRFYTMDQVVRKLRKLAEDRHLMPTNKRHADHPKSDVSTSQSPVEVTGKHAGPTVNFVLLGMAGTGKSASGNTILGKEFFISRTSSSPVTKECNKAETQIGGTHVCIIDTPDIFDDEIESSIKIKHVRDCKQLYQPGPCVYLLVMQVSRFTDGERDILKKLEKAFRSRIREQTIILFTRGEELQRANMSLGELLRHCQPDLKKIVEKCDNRCVVFENTAADSYQVEELMQTVDRMLQEQQKE